MLNALLKKMIYAGLGLLLIIKACSPADRAQSTQVKSGLDRVVESDYKGFEDKSLGIICNHTTKDRTGKHIVDLFHNNGKSTVKSIFAPEHGFRGDESAGAKIEDDIDPRTGAQIYSLYGKTRKPTPEMLAGVDALIYDIQDVGVRFYTYISTMSYCMEAAAENNIPIYVLDRPNPIRGDIVEGPILKEGYESFVGMHPIPIRYGMTAGELAVFINSEGYLKNQVKADLKVVELKGWEREQWYDQTDLPWIAPSPNMPDLETAIVYPGMCFMEGTNLSEGRGTNTPFLLFGAPWLDSKAIAQKLNNMNMPGINFSTTEFAPVEIPGKAYNPKYQDEKCQGIKLHITDRNQYRPVGSTIKILYTVYKTHPDQFQWRKSSIDRLTGSSKLRETFTENGSIDSLISDWQMEADAFKKFSKKYYIYGEEK